MGCNCIIAHAVTDEERERVTRELEYARSVDDRVGVMVRTAQLGGDCPARRKGES